MLEKTKLNYNPRLMAERLKKLRENKGLTQQALASEKYLKCNKATISEYESGTLPKSDALIFLSDLYGVSIDYLLGRSDYEHHEIEDLGSPLGLSEMSVKALKTLKDKRHRFADEHKRILESINRILEQIYIDFEDQKSFFEEYSFTVQTVFTPILAYIYSDRLELLDTIRPYDDKTYEEVPVYGYSDKTIKYPYEIGVDFYGESWTYEIKDLYRAKLKEEIIESLDIIRENIKTGKNSIYKRVGNTIVRK